MPPFSLMSGGSVLVGSWLLGWCGITLEYNLAEPMPADYRIRPATLADVDVLVHHRVAMFTDMGRPIDADRGRPRPSGPG